MMYSLLLQPVQVHTKNNETFYCSVYCTDNLHLIKKTYVSSRQGSKDFTSQNVELERNTGNGEGQVVGMIELYKTEANVRIVYYLSW